MPEEDANPDRQASDANAEAPKPETAPDEIQPASVEQPQPTQLTATALELPGLSAQPKEQAPVDAPPPSSDEDASIDVDADSESDDAAVSALPTHIPIRRAPHVDRDPDTTVPQKDVAIDVDGLDESFDEDEDVDEDDDDNLPDDSVPHQPQQTATIDLTESVQGTPPRRRYGPPHPDQDDMHDAAEADVDPEEGDDAQPEPGTDADEPDEPDVHGSEPEPIDLRESELENGESEAEPLAEENEPLDDEHDSGASPETDLESKDDADDSVVHVESVEEDTAPGPSETHDADHSVSEKPSAEEMSPADEKGETGDAVQQVKPESLPKLSQAEVVHERIERREEETQSDREQVAAETLAQASTMKPSLQSTPIPASPEAEMEGDDRDEVLDDEEGDDRGDGDALDSEVVVGDSEEPVGSEKERSEVLQSAAPSEAAALESKPLVADEHPQDTEAQGVSEGKPRSGKESSAVAEAGQPDNQAVVSDVQMIDVMAGGDELSAPAEAAADKLLHSDVSKAHDLLAIHKDTRMDDIPDSVALRKEDHVEGPAVVGEHMTDEKKLNIAPVVEDSVSTEHAARMASRAHTDSVQDSEKMAAQAVLELNRGIVSASQRKETRSSEEFEKPRNEPPMPTNLRKASSGIPAAPSEPHDEKENPTIDANRDAVEAEVGKETPVIAKSTTVRSKFVENNEGSTGASYQIAIGRPESDAQEKDQTLQKAADLKDDTQKAFTAQLPEPSAPSADNMNISDGRQVTTDALKIDNDPSAQPQASVNQPSDDSRQILERQKPATIPPKLTTPMFGIELPSRSGPVSFSSPPSFHRPQLSPTAAPFIPAALRAKEPLVPGREAAVPDASNEAAKQPEAAQSSPIEAAITQTGLITSETATAEKPGVDDGKEADTGMHVSTNEATSKSTSVTAGKAITPVGVATKVTLLKATNKGTLETAGKGTTSGEAATKVASLKARAVESAAKKAVTKQADQTLRRVPIKGTSGGMTYTVDNVAVIVREGSPKNVRRFSHCTVEARIRPDDESAIEFFEGQKSSNSSFALLSSKNNRIRIKKVVNKAFVFSVTVLGPSGQEKGNDVSKYFIHLQAHTFQVFYDACIKFSLDVTTDNERPKTVRFHEPKESRNETVRANVSLSVKKPISKEGRPNTPKVTSLDQKKLLQQKMAALKKKKAERSSEGSPKREKSHGGMEKLKTAKVPTPAPVKAKLKNTNTEVRPLPKSTSQGAKVKSVNQKAEMDITAPPAVGTPSMSSEPKLQLLTPKSRPVPTSPKKRPAFRMEERGENVTKKARLAMPERRLVDSAKSVATANLGEATSTSASENSSKKTKVLTPAQPAQDSLGTQKPAQEPSLTRKPISVVLKQPPPDMSISLEERENLEVNSKRLADLLTGLKAAGDPTLATDVESLPASLERCDPRSASDFFDRLHTFRPSTWRGFTPGHQLNPVECARRGWYNSGIDRLRSTDGAEVCGQFDTCFDTAAFTKEEGRLRELILGKGHKLLSGWVGDSCPVEFETLEGSSRVYSSSELKEIVEELMNTNIADTLEKNGFVWGGKELQEVSVRTKYARLAACNWRARASDEQELDLYCRWCNRSVMLAPECLAIMKGTETVTFNLRTSHYSFCPFHGEANDAVKRNERFMGLATVAQGDPKVTDPLGMLDGDANMTDV